LILYSVIFYPTKFNTDFITILKGKVRDKCSTFVYKGQKNFSNFVHNSMNENNSVIYVCMCNVWPREYKNVKMSNNSGTVDNIFESDSCCGVELTTAPALVEFCRQLKLNKFLKWTSTRSIFLLLRLLLVRLQSDALHTSQLLLGK
jgi:hypothetical protein